MSDTHPSLIKKPVLSVADLHLIALVMDGQPSFTEAECNRLEVIEDALADYLKIAVSPAWRELEALVS